MVLSKKLHKGVGTTNRFLCYVQMLFSVLCIAVVTNFVSVCNASEDVIIAEGNGFTLTAADVDKVKAYYDKTPIRAMEAEYHQVSFKIKIFAYEAVERHLDQGLNIPQEETDTVDAWLKLADAYYKKVIEEYPVSDLSIVSYYRAFPERFRNDGDDTADVNQKPLDAESSKRVRSIIIEAKKQTILIETLNHLKEKYKIRFY